MKFLGETLAFVVIIAFFLTLSDPERAGAIVGKFLNAIAVEMGWHP